MKIYINPRGIGADNYELMIKRFPQVAFTDKIDPDIDAAFAFPSFPIKKNLDKTPKLKWVQLLSAGFNNIDVKEIMRRKITITNAKDVYSITIAEDIVTKILVLNRDVKTYIEQMKSGLWIKHNFEPEIYGSTIGFLGAGSIAKKTAQRIKPFQARLICYRKSKSKDPAFDETYTGEEGLEYVLKTSDIVVVTLPLNDETNNLLDKNRIALMKNTSILINVSRGEVIDQDALIEALEKGNIRGAGLDVTVPEPLPSDSPLWHMDNVFITPHNAFSSPMMFKRLTQLLSDNLHLYLANKDLINTIYTSNKKH